MDGGQTRIRFRLSTITCLVLIAAALAACRRTAPPASGAKMIVLGIDGMDPAFLEQHWADLPNLDRLRRTGTFTRLGTTIPPQSPVAWSTFITGRDPGGHGIFDFVHRDPATMQPFSSMGKTVEPKHKLPLGPYELPLSSGEVVSFRQGKPFYQALSEAGVHCTVLRMPTNFPPSRCECEQLAGMGTPDLEGTFGTFTFFTDDPARAAADVPGGRVVPVRSRSSDFVLPVRGPANTLRKDRRPTTIDIVAHIDPASNAARFDVQDTRILLRAGEWSDWVRVSFPLVPGLKSVRGMLRIYAQQLTPTLRIYVSPVNLDPASPELAISTPATYSRDLARAIGPYYTQGIAEDTAALRQGIFDVREYIAQTRLVADEQMGLLHHAVEHFEQGFLFLHFLGIDQNSHMLWGRHPDLLLDTYKIVDRNVGWVMDRARDATLVVMSDHGFARFDRAVNLNTWLLREGFLSVDTAGRTDWSNTQAYGMGLNGLYLNLAGRERHGTVNPGTHAEITLRVLARRLREFRDPKTGDQPFADAWQPTDAFHGREALAFAPDLIVGYRPGYRGSWQGALGEATAEIVEDNRDAWIGDHCISPQFVPGVLLVNRPVRLQDPQLADLTATILDAFHTARPNGVAGRVLF
jgi:predicted AlkP superfamily phosphohydrolase/phosphomutase